VCSGFRNAEPPCNTRQHVIRIEIMAVQIFLSTVTDEFCDYRDQLRSDLTRHNVEVKVQEDFKDYGVVTLDKLDLYISTCDAVVHLVGDMTGSNAHPASTTSIITKYPDIIDKLPPLREALDNGFGISYTQWEAWLALYHGKVLLIAKAEDGAPRGQNYSPTTRSRAAQAVHLQRLRAVERYPGFLFTSPDNLAKQIVLTTILDLLAADKRGHLPREGLGFPFPSLIAVLLILLLTPPAADQLAKTLGVSLAAPLSLIGSVSGLVLALIFWRYLGILSAGSEAPGSLERQAYDGLRSSIPTGGLAAHLYSSWLGRCLDVVDRFFGDSDMVHPTLFPRAFGLRSPAPLWTAAAFDRCLLLALIYPIATILIIWAISGHVGPAEAALHLKSNLPGWHRGFAVAVVGVVVFAILRAAQLRGWAAWVWFASAMMMAVLAGVVALDLSVIEILFVGCMAIAGMIVVVITRLLALGEVEPSVYVGFDTRYVGVGVLCVAGLIVIAIASGTGGSFALPVLVGDMAILTAAGAVAVSSDMAMKRRRYGMFLAILLPAAIAVCLSASLLLSSLEGWRTAGPLLLFFGLLTLINAPFDWASLGLTRALLRRGLELGGWSPYLLAIADAIFAVIIVVLLIFVMVIAVQAFDHLAEHGGGAPVLVLNRFLAGIAEYPGAPEYWWLYALLLSTMIPSLLNLFIGGTALMRAAPGLPQLLLRYMPAGRAVPIFDRAWVAFVLTAQVAVGVILGVMAQAFLALGLIGYVMPWLAIGLLDLARYIADLDLPMRAWQLFDGLGQALSR